MGDLSGRVAGITGPTRGIGKAHGEAMAWRAAPPAEYNGNLPTHNDLEAFGVLTADRKAQRLRQLP